MSTNTGGKNPECPFGNIRVSAVTECAETMLSETDEVTCISDCSTRERGHTHVCARTHCLHSCLPVGKEETVAVVARLSECALFYSDDTWEPSNTYVILKKWVVLFLKAIP